MSESTEKVPQGMRELTIEEQTSRWEQESLDQLLTEERGYNRQQVRYDDLRRAVGKVIMQKMLDAGLGIGQAYVREDGVGATLQTKETRTISRDKLILHNVDEHVIDECTNVSVSKPFIVVRDPKAKAEKS